MCIKICTSLLIVRWFGTWGEGIYLKVGQFTEINGNKGFILNGIEVLVKNCKKKLF
jgi:hypothetical protein